MRKIKTIFAIVLCVIFSFTLVGCSLSFGVSRVFPTNSNEEYIQKGEEGKEDIYVSDNVAYTLRDGEFVVTEVDERARFVTIKSEIDGMPVTVIEDIYERGFIPDGGEYGNMCSIVIPESIKKIEDYAFWHCTKLVEVVNLSKIEFEIGTTKNGYVAYYAKDIYTSLDYESKIKEKDEIITYEDGEDCILLGYDESGDFVIPDYITEIRGLISTNLSSLEINSKFIINNYYEEAQKFRQDDEEDVLFDYYVLEALLHGLDEDNVLNTIYYCVGTPFGVEGDWKSCKLYIDDLATIESYRLFGYLFCDYGSLYILSTIEIPNSYCSFDVYRYNENTNKYEKITIEYVPYGVVEYNQKTYVRYVYKENGAFPYVISD